MKSTISALIILAFSSLALAQCPSEKKYDRFADKTTEICGGLYSTNKVESDGSSAETFSITVYVEYSSQERHRPLTIAVNIANIQLVRRGIARPHLDGQSVLYLLTDNKRGELRVGKYTPVPVEGALAEIIEVPLNADSLEALINAHRVEGRIAGREFQFTEAGLAALQKYLLELKPLWVLERPSRRTKRPVD
jgi:hypothetical protein